MHAGRCFVLVAVVASLSIAGLAQSRRGVFVASRDHPAIAYSTSQPTGAAAVVNRRIQEGSLRLDFDPDNGYLVSLLEALGVPVESQALVFSQTSFQGSLIHMRNPRAVYFNDRVAVGWVRGGPALEIASHDPTQGVVFYTLNQKPEPRPQLTRNDQCLACHLSWDTLGVPGLMIQSVFPLPDDKYSYAAGFTTDHRSPLSERWGGWYVTGRHGAASHMGNIPVMPADAGITTLVDPTRPIESLAEKLDLKGFPSPYSDVVAQMVLAHQTRMTNLITRLGWEARVAAVDSTADSRARVQEAVVELVDYLLFVDEATLATPVRGTAGFAERFMAQGPRDRQGRSLRQFDLERRLMRYPCSYMIYSEAFAALPDDTREQVYARMWRILSGQDTAPRYARLSRADREAVIEILRDTVTALPPFFARL